MLVVILAAGSAVGLSVCARMNARVPEAARATSPSVAAATSTNPETARPARVDFATQIRPILESRCQPCHFSGGKVYDRMPFDRPETIKTLGTKLFTRIKAEDERRLIRDFLAQE
jgi:hypothetical protein